MQWYARQVANNPSLVILFVLVMTTTCIIIALTLNDLPTFKDPLLGFEPRGTELAQRTTAWKNLFESTSWNGPLTLYPGRIVSNSHNSTSQVSPWEKLMKGGNGKAEDNTSAEDSVSTWLELETEEQNLDHMLEKGELDVKHTLFHRGFGHRKPQRITPLGTNKFFCNNPSRDYAHVIIQSTTGKNLFTLKGLKSVCQIDDKRLRKSPNFPKLCEQTSRRSCCKSWSIPNYVALLCNRSSCLDITQQDVTYVLKLLASCSAFYHDMKLSHDCATDPALCHGIPKQCTEYDAVYNMLHYLVDVDFLNPKTPHYNTPRLIYTSIFLPVARSSQALDYYRDLEQMKLSDGIVEVVGMELGLKFHLFDICLIHDTVYVGLAGGLIFVLLWMYSSSFFVTFMTIMTVAFSLATAYFMYTVVYQIKFFPFMNLLTIVIIIGIGADDACIYCKIWVCAKTEKTNGTLVKLVRDTLHHACLSMFVTSVTTAAAFFGSVISNITAVRCFSIFAGTAVLANFIFTVSWLPASVIMAEKWCSSTCCLCIPPLGVYLPQIQRFWWWSTVCNSVWKLHYSFTDTSRVFFEKILPCIIVKPRYFWLILFTGFAAAAAVIVFYYPKLRLPDSKEFQIFSADHPFERYDLVLKKYFWFEKARDRDVYRKLPIRIVWGVLPVDNGNYLNPYDRGTIVFDPQFNVTSQDSQNWLLSFCISLRNQSFYQLTHGPLLSNCFIETFKTWMERQCMDGFSDRTPCCESSKFPFTEEIFNLCIREAINVLHHTPGYFFIPGIEGPRFSKSSGDIKAVVVEYDSIFTYSNSYNEINEFRTQVDGWVTNMMKSAPVGMKNGWFTSHLEFFDLQDSLSQGTHIAIGVAIGVSFIALLITTLNLLISIYAILTIGCIITVTIASLVILGYKLNVLESTTVSIAIGLAVDLTLHYGVAYALSPQEDRESSVIFCVARVGSPVAMAAFTTFMAGALMFPSVVLAYLQIGTFLVILMTVSWLYATFFFLPLLSIMGPQNGQLQLSYPTVHCCDTSGVPAEKAPYALSESTLSSSSASYPNQIPTSESHELEPLTNLKGNRIDIPKYSKKKHGQRASRPRSGSFSSALSKTRDSSFPVQNNRTPRKISLPTVNVTFHGDPSPQHITGAISSSTIVCNEEEKEVMVPSAQKNEVSETWTRKEISV